MQLAEANSRAIRRAAMWRQGLAFFIWVLLIIALAGPETLGKAVPLPRSGRDILLMVDLSPSMSLPDFTFGGHQATRLDVVKKVAGKFIAERQGDRIGLIVFGTKAYLRMPFSFDLKTAQDILQDTSVGLAGESTAIGDALGLAVKHLAQTNDHSRVVILLTDGGDNSSVLPPREATQLAAKNKIRIYTIGIGADRLVVPTLLGPQVFNASADLDEALLKQIADDTQGQFFRAKDTEGLEQIYREIDQLEPVITESNLLRPSIPYYPWPLALALLLSVWLVSQKLWRKSSLKIVKPVTQMTEGTPA